MPGYSLIIGTTSFITPAIKMKRILIYPIRVVFPFASSSYDTIRSEILSSIPYPLVLCSNSPLTRSVAPVMSIIIFYFIFNSMPAKYISIRKNITKNYTFHFQYCFQDNEHNFNSLCARTKSSIYYVFSYSEES